PAGLDLGAVTPEEIAASILAELVQVRRRGSTSAENSDQISIREPTGEIAVATTSPDTAIDPVCGMVVEIAGARHYTVLDGRDFYFCCPACKRLFETPSIETEGEGYTYGIFWYSNYCCSHRESLGLPARC